MCIKCMTRAAIIAAVSLTTSTQIGHAETSQQAMAAEAQGLVKSFAGTLKSTLVAGIKDGGPVNAIGICNHAAPLIASQKSEKSGWKIARTTTKLRNPSNAPDEWEAKVLASFAKKKAAGGDLKTMQFYETVEMNGKKTFRYMKAIPVGKPCLNCHGENLKAPVAAAIKEKYPHDNATGFKLGDLRGAFTLTKPLN